MKEKKFEKVVEWDHPDFENKFGYWCFSIFIFPLTILFFLFFGWAYGIWYWYDTNKINIETCEKVYWREI